MQTDKSDLITDEQRLVRATYHSGHEIATYDDGFGPLWISRNSIGINGIVRAQTWEEAYEICEDEFFAEADETVEELRKEYGFRREHVKIVNDGRREREVVESDYVDGRLPSDMFVSWETRETPDADAWIENELFCEAYGFRPNGPNERDKHKHGIYAKDLNGDYLDPLTRELADEIGITVVVEYEGEEDEHAEG